MSPAYHYRKCVICGIRAGRSNEEKRKFMSQFPKDEDRCKAWLKAVGIEELVHVPIEKLHQLRYVCENHFRKKDFNRKGNRLKRSAIPVMNLPAVQLTDAQLVGFPLYIWRDENDPISVQASEETFSGTTLVEIRPNRVVENSPTGQEDGESHWQESQVNELESQENPRDSDLLQESQVNELESQEDPRHCDLLQETHVNELESQEDLQETQVDLQEFQVEVEECEQDSLDDELPLTQDDCQAEPSEWGQIKLDLLDVEPNQNAETVPLKNKTAVHLGAKSLEAIVAEWKEVEERKEVSERVQCSKCSACIQRQATLFRCVECADAALCSDCATRTHASHCVMRMPSTRVYRVLEDIFQRLKLEVRARLYPDNDMLHLDKRWVEDTAGGKKYTHHSTMPAAEECVPDEEWLDEAALNSDGGEQPPDNPDPLFQHLPLIEVKEEDSDEEAASVLSDSTHDSSVKLQMDSLAATLDMEENKYLRQYDSRKSTSKNKITDTKHERLERLNEKDKRIGARLLLRNIESKISTEQNDRINFTQRKRPAREREYSLEDYEESEKKSSETKFSKASRISRNMKLEQEQTSLTRKKDRSLLEPT